MKQAATNLLALASTAYAAASSPAGTKSGCYWNTDAGQFNTRFGHDFSVDLYGTVENLIPSTYTVNQGVNPLARRFDIANIGFDGVEKALTLTVPGGQSNGPISVAQLATSYSDILYGSVRTVAKISNVPGTTHGFIFYANDTQEVDFAFLTSDTSKAWLTNEQVTYTSPYSTYSVAAPGDASSAYHEYRLDWLPGVSKFYIDGVLVQTITDNAPSTPGSWIWNNWSNGNAWAQGPPLSDSVLKIRSIDGYFNRTTVADNINLNPSSCPAVSSSSSSVAPSSTVVSSSSSSVVSSSSSSVKSSSSSVVSSSSSVAPSSSSIVSSSSTVSSSSVATTSSATLSSSSSSSSSVAPATSSSAAAVTNFYIKDANNKLVNVPSGQDGVANYVTSQNSATSFYIDSKTGYLYETGAPYAANRGTSAKPEITYFSTIGLGYSYITCSQNTAQTWLECKANGVAQQAMTCGNDGLLYFAPTIPSTCAWVPLYYVSSTSASVSASSVALTTSSSSSSSSSSVAPTTSSTSSSVAPTTSSVAAQATVSFTTITTAWTGTFTTTTTAVSGLAATVYVQTPAKKGDVISTSSTAKASYTTVTTHSGTAGSVGYITATPKVAGATTTVTVVYPTPVTTCGNQGINFAAYTNKYSGGQATYGYPSFSPEAYKKVSPWFSDDTTYIAESNDGSGTKINVYGYGPLDASTLVLDHTFYLFASQTGYYSLNVPYTDDIQFVWVGSKAVTGWTRANADITQFWSSQIATQTPQTLAYYLTVGTYLPIRTLFANGGGQGDLRFNIYAPDGTSVLSSNAGQNSGVSSVDIVEFPCNSALGAQFPAWGKET
ncbi:concanavalin A-like lectin/glucanase [Aureobasidium pullulans]|nr:concanavalin A-like lectin/glucanase [Aureobasidium pullulans]